MHKSQSHDWQRAYWMDLVGIVLLLWASYLLGHTAGYHRYSYYENLRDVVFFAWLVSAARFYVFRVWPGVVLSIVVAWLFNPIVPVTMRKWQWQPYDHWTMILSLIGAAALAFLSIRANRHSDASTKTEP